MAVVDRPEFVLAARDATKGAFTSVKKNFDEMNRQVSAFRVGFAALGGAAAVAGLSAITFGSIKTIAALDDMSESTGLSVETLDKLSQVATIGGHAMEGITKSMSKFAKNIGEAKTGNKELQNTFAAMGISIDDLRSKNIDDLYIEFAKKIATADDAQVALAISTKLTGKGAAEQIPFFKDLAEQGLRNARITTEQAAAAEVLEKEFGKLKVSGQQLGINIANAVIPSLTEMAQTLNEAVRLTGSLANAFVALAGINPFTDVSTKLKEFRADLVDLEKGEGLGNLFRKVVGVQGAAIQLRKDQIEILKFQQRQEALRGRTGPEFEDARDRAARAAKNQPFKIDASKIKDDGDKIRKAELDLVTSRAKIIAAQEKQLADQRLSILETFYSEGLIAEKEYWDTRRAIQEGATAAALKAIDVELQARRAAVGEATKSGDKAAALGAQKDLEEVVARRKQLEQETSFAVQKSFLEQARAAEVYKDALLQIEIELDRISGKTADATTKSFDLQNRSLRRKLETNKDQGGLQQLQDLKQATIAQAQFSEAREKAGEATRALALQEERIQNSLKVGAISELEGLRRTETARKESLGTLRTMAEQLDALAESSGIEKLRLDALAFRIELEALEAESSLVAQKFDTIFESGFTEFFTSVVTGTKSVKDAFKDMANSITAEISKLVAQDLAKRAFGAISGSTSGGASNIGSFFASLLGGSFASGISYVPRDMLAMVHQGEKITPAGQNQGGSGVVVNLSYAGSGGDSRTAEQFAVRVGREVSRATRRSA